MGLHGFVAAGAVGALVCWKGQCGRLPGLQDNPVCPDADADMRLVIITVFTVFFYHLDFISPGHICNQIFQSYAERLPSISFTKLYLSSTYAKKVTCSTSANFCVKLEGRKYSKPEIMNYAFSYYPKALDPIGFEQKS